MLFLTNTFFDIVCYIVFRYARVRIHLLSKIIPKLFPILGHLD